MNINRILIGTLLLSLSLMLGGCYTLQTIRTKRLKTEKLTHKKYWIAGAYLKDGTYHSFDKESDVVRMKYQLPATYYGGVWAGDTLYGVSSSWENARIPIELIKMYEMITDKEGTSWIDAVYLNDGSYIQFDTRDPDLLDRKNLPLYHRRPLIDRDTLKGFVYRLKPLAIPVDQIEKLRVHKVDVFVSTFFPAILVGGWIYGAATFTWDMSFGGGGIL